MSNTFVNRYRLMLASEATEGTDAVAAILTDADADIIYQSPDEATVLNQRVMYNPSRQRASNAGVPGISFGDRANVSIVQGMTGKRGSGAGNEQPYYAPLLAAMGLGVTVVSGTSAVYKPSTVQQASMTVYKWTRNTSDNNWRLEYTTGCRGTGTFTMETQSEAKLSFTGTGLYTGLPSDPAAFFGTDGAIDLLKDGSTSVTARNTGTEVQANKTVLGCKGMTVSYNSTTLPVRAIEINLNRATTAIMTMNGSGSVSQVLLSVSDATRVEGSFDLHDSASAFEALLDALAADTEAAIALSYGNGTDTIAWAMPKAQIGMYSEGANGDIRTYTFPFYLSGNWSNLAADNELTITYT